MSRLFSIRALLAMLLFAAIGTSVSHAAVVYSNFGSSDSYFIDSGWLVSGLVSGVEPFVDGFAFTPSANYKLDSIELAAGYFFTGTNSLIVKLMGDSSGKPGTELEQWIFNNIEYYNPSEILFGNSISNPLLESGMQYWLVAFPGNFDSVMAWNLNDQSVIGLMAVSVDGGLNWSLGAAQEGAFRISGTPVSAVPEPSTLLLLGSGLIGLVGFRRKFKK